ncbi:MAG: prephenate dehydrogenase/arogenate dehydrogenase family protein [Kiritimatiellae bacterium]|nr:prephenate dehydrogenase/arogenate dehydrogenase family protein [Kiritimatiellia bacterium]
MSKNVAILGLGLMGGSLGMALRNLTRDRPHVRGYARREETRDAALRDGVVDSVFDDPADCCVGADIVVVCVPVFAIEDVLRESLAGIEQGTVVTDVGSTKNALSEKAARLLARQGAIFVGSHPIAGSEASGIEAARADLYNNAVVVVTPNSDTPQSCIDDVYRLWASLGSRVRQMSALVHDELLARTSHLPHLVAAVLTRAVLRDDEADAFCGSGFLDSTRIASGTEDIWLDIVQSNREAILVELDVMRDELYALRALVAHGGDEDVRSYLRDARLKRLRMDDAGISAHE